MYTADVGKDVLKEMDAFFEMLRQKHPDVDITLSTTQEMTMPELSPEPSTSYESAQAVSIRKRPPPPKLRPPPPSHSVRTSAKKRRTATPGTHTHTGPFNNYSMYVFLIKTGPFGYDGVPPPILNGTTEDPPCPILPPGAMHHPAKTKLAGWFMCSRLGECSKAVHTVPKVLEGPQTVKCLGLTHCI